MAKGKNARKEKKKTKKNKGNPKAPAGKLDSDQKQFEKRWNS